MWEARYFSTLRWVGTTDMNSDAPDLVTYHSQLRTHEASYWHYIAPARSVASFSIAWLAGLRYLDVDETLSNQSKPTNSTTMQVTEHRVSTKSRLLGLQLGGLIEYHSDALFSCGATFKVGALFNRGQGLQTITGDDTAATGDDTAAPTPATPFRNQRQRSHYAYMIHFAPALNITPSKQLLFSLSYQLLYVGNLATAEQNFRFTIPNSPLNQHGSAIYHGVLGSMQLRF